MEGRMGLLWLMVQGYSPSQQEGQAAGVCDSFPQQGRVQRSLLLLSRLLLVINSRPQPWVLPLVRTRLNQPTLTTRSRACPVAGYMVTLGPDRR